MSSNIFRLQAVKQRTGLSRSSIYAQIAAGKFPQQIHLGPRAVGWLESEVDKWVTARIEESRGGAQ